MDNQLDILVRLESKVDVIGDRVDRHEMKNEARSNGISKKMEEFSEKIHDLALDVTIKNNKIREDIQRSKIIALTAGLSFILTVSIEVIKYFMGIK